MSDVIQIPVGEYLIGDDSIPNAGPRHRRKLRDTAWMDAQPVTWAHFEVFVEGGGYSKELLERCNITSPASRRGSSVDERVRSLVGQFLESISRGFASRAAALLQPIAGLTWFEASEVARFYGGRLPYEVEWEIAHSGTAKNRDIAQCDSARPIPRSRLGCSVLIGHLQEWTLDAFSNKYWRADFEKRGNDWHAESSESGVTVRGAGPEDMFQHVSYRFMSAPNETNPFRGFRRVWDKKPTIEDIVPSWRRH